MFKSLMVLAAALALSSCTVISPSERGVRYNFGSLSEEPLNPGTHLWIPYISGASTIDLQIRSFELKTSSGTKDQQEVSTTCIINLQLQSDKVVDTVKNFGGEEALFSRILPLVQENISANVSKFSAEEILTKRGQLKLQIEEMVRKDLTKYGIVVHDLSIKDLQYSPEYSKAIERKQIAEQEAKQAEYDTQKATQTANAAIAKATGLAEANRLTQKTLTPELIQYEAIHKWNGQLPQFSGSNAVPFINLKQ